METRNIAWSANPLINTVVRKIVLALAIGVMAVTKTLVRVSLLMTTLSSMALLPSL